MKQPSGNRNKENELIFECYTKTLKEDHEINEYDWPIGELDANGNDVGNSVVDDIENKKLALHELIDDLSDEQIEQMYQIAISG